LLIQPENGEREKTKRPFWVAKNRKTLGGCERKLMPGDGRKSTPVEKAIKRQIKLWNKRFGKKKKQAKRKKK